MGYVLFRFSKRILHLLKTLLSNLAQKNVFNIVWLKASKHLVLVLEVLIYSEHIFGQTCFWNSREENPRQDPLSRGVKRGVRAQTGPVKLRGQTRCQGSVKSDWEGHNLTKLKKIPAIEFQNAITKVASVYYINWYILIMTCFQST